VRKVRNYLIGQFTSPGQPGHCFRPYFEYLRDALKVPDFSQGDNEKYHFILPSFFECLIALKKRTQPFQLIFRTFGDDLPEIINEFNLFCAGKHPYFPSSKTGLVFDGSDGQPDYTITSKNTGTFFRGPDFKKCSLVMGTIEQVPKMKFGVEWYKTDAPKEIQQSVIEIYDSYPEIYQFLTKWAKNHHKKDATDVGHCALALRDYYDFWGANNCSYNSGKLLLIDPEDTSIHQVFFDDNANIDRFYESKYLIVDCRTVSGESLAPPDTINQFVVNAGGLYAIADRKYYLKCIEVCRKKRLAAKPVGLSASGEFTELFAKLRAHVPSDDKV